MTEAWKDMARQAGFYTVDDRMRTIAQTTQTAEWCGLKIVGHPIMPEGYVALVTNKSATIIGPHGAWSVGFSPFAKGDA